eukprot:TRINITY_DN6924_c0_g1_i5.p1 TRINITY_DN6924_c0_g1~~TRINITY_DN6924_c0_g1_i5.p1  ORF type:complete len:374 (+),score=-6.71 TRINITY_DN6924_c0_g1_i5:474-1595(+)
MHAHTHMDTTLEQLKDMRRAYQSFRMHTEPRYTGDTSRPSSFARHLCPNLGILPALSNQLRARHLIQSGMPFRSTGPRFENGGQIQNMLAEVTNEVAALDLKKREFEAQCRHELAELDRLKERALADARTAFEIERSEKSKTLDEREQVLREREQAFERASEFVAEANLQRLNRIKLNVGGTKFETSRSTLSSSFDPDSMLAAMFSGRHSLEKDENGCVFIDRNGDLFGIILEWLRTGIAPQNLDRFTRERLLEEANYFQLGKLHALLTNNDNDRKDTICQLVFQVHDYEPSLAQYGGPDPGSCSISGGRFDPHAPCSHAQTWRLEEGTCDHALEIIAQRVQAIYAAGFRYKATLAESSRESRGFHHYLFENI